MCEIKYPNEHETFTIEDFRVDNAICTPDYYIHVVNDETGVCRRICDTWNFSLAMNRFRSLQAQCAKGFHVELTVGISRGQVRARIL